MRPVDYDKQIIPMSLQQVQGGDLAHIGETVSIDGSSSQTRRKSCGRISRFARGKRKSGEGRKEFPVRTLGRSFGNGADWVGTQRRVSARLTEDLSRRLPAF
ncbi:MAG TPA: hypothetical protein VE860_04540 [Chthoniobacterales bacterium]|nr:hypothetical protein [Chthoniobacterales bacterium]